MALSTVVPKLMTAEEFSELPDPRDGSRQELVKGVVETMPPPSFYHGRCCSRLNRRLGNFIEEDEKWLARQREIKEQWLAQEEQSRDKAFRVSAIAPKIQRVRQDYYAARRARPHDTFYRKGLLAAARQAAAG